MYCPKYHINSVNVFGTITEIDVEHQFIKVESQRGITLAYWDNEKLTEALSSYEVGQPISFTASMVVEERNGYLVIGRLLTDPVAFVAGVVTKNIEKKMAGKANPKPVCEFSIGQSSWNNGEANFISIECWRPELFDKIFAGNFIAIEGIPVQEFYTDKDGNNRSKVKLLVDRISGLSERKAGAIPVAPPSPGFIKNKSAAITSNEVAAEAGEPIDF